MSTETHCQICGRLIQAAGGLIAHHGYERPGWGNQTASCLGARFAPYEHERDRILTVIAILESQRQNVERTLAEYNTSPPPLLRTKRNKQWMTYERPADLTTNTEYTRILADMKQRCKTQIDYCSSTIERLKVRFDSWKPPQELSIEDIA